MNVSQTFFTVTHGQNSSSCWNPIGLGVINQTQSVNKFTLLTLEIIERILSIKVYAFFSKRKYNKNKHFTRNTALVNNTDLKKNNKKNGVLVFFDSDCNLKNRNAKKHTYI